MEGANAIKVAEDIVGIVVRSFYDEDAVVVMDGLLILTRQGGIKDQDLAQQLNLQNKLVRRQLVQLENDNLVRSVERKEMHGNREVNVQYWHVDYKLAVDAVKLRLRRMKKALEEAPVQRTMQYVCNRCIDDDERHPTWDEFSVQELGTQLPFECPFCKEELDEEECNLDDQVQFNTQFTCFTSTNVQTLTPEELLARAAVWTLVKKSKNSSRNSWGCFASPRI
jgi:transcription initiation factor IIE alpha subunit